MGNRGHCPLIPMSPSSPIFPSPFNAVNRNVCQLLPWQPAQAGSRSLLMLAGHPAEVDNEGRERLILECRTGFGTYGLEYASVCKHNEMCHSTIIYLPLSVCEPFSKR